jgi:hypothetical protein
MHLEYYSPPGPPNHLISFALRQHCCETRLIVVLRLDCDCGPRIRSIFDRFEVGHGVSFVIVNLWVRDPFFLFTRLLTWSVDIKYSSFYTPLETYSNLTTDSVS